MGCASSVTLKTRTSSLSITARREWPLVGDLDFRFRSNCDVAGPSGRSGTTSRQLFVRSTTYLVRRTESRTASLPEFVARRHLIRRANSSCAGRGLSSPLFDARLRCGVSRTRYQVFWTRRYGLRSEVYRTFSYVSKTRTFDEVYVSVRQRRALATRDEQSES